MKPVIKKKKKYGKSIPRYILPRGTPNYQAFEFLQRIRWTHTNPTTVSHCFCCRGSDYGSHEPGQIPQSRIITSLRISIVIQQETSGFRFSKPTFLVIKAPNYYVDATPEHVANSLNIPVAQVTNETIYKFVNEQIRAYLSYDVGNFATPTGATPLPQNQQMISSQNSYLQRSLFFKHKSLITFSKPQYTVNFNYKHNSSHEPLILNENDALFFVMYTPHVSTLLYENSWVYTVFTDMEYLIN